MFSDNEDFLRILFLGMVVFAGYYIICYYLEIKERERNPELGPMIERYDKREDPLDYVCLKHLGFDLNLFGAKLIVVLGAVGLIHMYTEWLWWMEKWFS